MATFDISKVFSMDGSIEYTSGGVISKQIIKNKAGNVTLFSFDKGQGLTEHSASYDALVQVIDGEVEIKIDRNWDNILERMDVLDKITNILSYAEETVEINLVN